LSFAIGSTRKNFRLSFFAHVEKSSFVFLPQTAIRRRRNPTAVRRM
jgi:hypothetical protein